MALFVFLPRLAILPLKLFELCWLFVAYVGFLCKNGGSYQPLPLVTPQSHYLVITHLVILKILLACPVSS